MDTKVPHRTYFYICGLVLVGGQFWPPSEMGSFTLKEMDARIGLIQMGMYIVLSG